MKLGRLEAVPARSIWTNEARDFTPWLLADAGRLGEALGIELELTDAEHPTSLCWLVRTTRVESVAGP